MSVNKVVLVGNVGKDPVVRYFDKGVAKATFPLATSESYTNQQGETITSTEWHNIVLWRALAEVAEKTVKKGAQVYIVGKIKTRSYVDKDGVNKYITEILADTFFILEKKQVPVSNGQQHETTKNESQNNNSVNEPVPNYQSGKSTTESDDFYPNNIIKNGPVPNQTDDDLPF